MKFKYRFSIPKIKCNEDIASGFLVSDDKVITAVHSIKEYLSDESNLIEVIFNDKNGKKINVSAEPILPSNGEIDDYEIVVLRLSETIRDINPLECIDYNFEDIADVCTYGYPAVRENEGTLIEMQVIGETDYLDLKVKSDSIKDYQGCSGGPLLYKNFIVGVMLEQVSEDGEASRIGAISLKKYREYFNEINISLFEKAYDIYRLEENLMDCTNPKISLNFFDYEEKEFEEEFLRMLSTQSTIYLQGKTQEEVMYYVLYIIKTRARHLIPKIIIINELVKWNELKDKCEDKILIPNFNSNVVEMIPKNANVIIYGEEDFLGNKEPLRLNKRTLDNMRDKLNGEIDDLIIAHQLVSQSNGLYSVFKRKVFEGKNGKPKWEEYAQPNLLPALLASSWKNNTKDNEFIEQLSNENYKDYIESISIITNGEDPFILHYNSGYEEIFKLANVEESWEILFSKINQDKLNQFKALVIEVLSEIPAKYDLPVKEHYRSSLITKEEIEYSSTLKKGIIRSLIALALKENSNAFNYQRFVDDIFKQLFSQIKEKQQWFAIAEFLPLIAEASPQIFVDFIEEEVNSSKSGIWQLFENVGDSLFGRNYYTHMLWALEKLLCLENVAITVIKLLVKLAEKKIDYKISNSPLSTLAQALSGWLHEINVSLDEKIELVEYIVATSPIGWDFLKQILPDRSNHGGFLSMTRLDYRTYEFEFKLEYSNQLFKTYSEYTSIAIKTANEDLDKWKIIFDKCLFIELGLYDLVKENLSLVISKIESDENKYKLKQKLREIIYRHRFFKDSDWALKEEDVLKIEELFNLITFENKIYDYLHLFVNEQIMELNPIPYSRDERKEYEKEREQLRVERVKALKFIIKCKDYSIWNLISILKLHDENMWSQRVIGNILAVEFNQYDFNDKLLTEALNQDANILFISYLEAAYSKQGFQVIKRALGILLGQEEQIIPVLKVARVNEEFLELLDSYSKDIQNKYWSDFTINWDIVDRSIQDRVWSQLLDNKNFNSLLRMIDLYFKKDLEKNIEVLEGILLNSGNFSVNNYDSYLIIQVFENIYIEASSKIERTLYLRVCQLEWAYFSLLIDHLPPKYLMEELKTDPTFLASLIQAAYKSSKEEKEVGEMQKKLGEQAWNVLYKLKFCPCVDQNKNISSERLEDWVKEFLKEIDKNGQEKIGRQILGECFSYSPLSDEDIYPHVAVCEVFQKYYTEDIGKGFLLGVLNSRGTYWETRGREEETLAAKYSKYAKKIRIKFPKVSTELLKISEDYKRQAFQVRERASYDL
ncbi:serine protease [Peribacillus simplex]|uniref:Serine protease n=1 Tax=Peribacillus simplex TaxID=1478 RepID=A0AAN2TPW8_9BACI|nr:serine protease [Peribacillus simplex]CEG24557.1 hypothetical protein BN1180_05372 [Peribacillus simplex]